MKKTVIALVVTLPGFVSVAQAASKYDTWYTGGKLGWSQYHDTGFYGNGYYNRIDNGPSIDGQLGAGAFFGFQTNQYLGFELGYDWLNRMAYKGNINNGFLQAQGISLAAKLNYPLTDNLDIYTRLGSIVWHADSKGAYDNGKLDRRNQHETGVYPMAALGMEYAWTKNWATRLDYQWVNNIADADTIGTRPDNSILSIGVSYRFAHEEVPVPASAPIIQPKHFTLKSNVLFNFDIATLKPEGQQALNQLYSQLSSMHPKDCSVIVLSHTDRIGSDVYNHKLAKARAQSVVNYLVSKGISADKISVRSMGKSNPVTGNTCNSVKDRTAVISCLGPDRRVEIEVKGIKNVVTQPRLKLS